MRYYIKVQAAPYHAKQAGRVSRGMALHIFGARSGVEGGSHATAALPTPRKIKLGAHCTGHCLELEDVSMGPGNLTLIWFRTLDRPGHVLQKKGA